MSSKERNRNDDGGRGRSRRGGRRSDNQQTGRPINRAERMQILDIWYQIDTRSRGELLNFLGSMPIERSAPTAPPSTQISGKKTSAEEGAKPRRQRPWERDILRDIPSIRAWGEGTSEDRKLDVKTTRVVSILTGVIARGRSQGHTDQEISDSINANIDDPAALRSLFPRTDRGHQGEDVNDVSRNSAVSAEAMDTEVSQQVGASSTAAAADTSSLELAVAGVSLAPGSPGGSGLASLRRSPSSASTTVQKYSSVRGPMDPVRRWGDMSDEDEKDGSETDRSPKRTKRKRGTSKSPAGKELSANLKPPPKGGGRPPRGGKG